MAEIAEQKTEETIIEEIGNNGVLAVLSKAEIDVQIATAKQYPRSVKQFRTEAINMATLTEEIAQECIYALPRAGKTIEGASARFAEIIASAWGNCRAGARVIGEEGDFVIAQGAFHDLERNVAITYEVKRRIVDKYGKRYTPDMIGVTANAACSIALRNAVLKGIPKAFWKDIYDSTRKIIAGDSKTLANRRAEALSYLQKLGATQEMICRTLEVVGIEDIGLDELVTLKGLATAIKEGETTVEQAFTITNEEKVSVKTARNTEALKKKLEAQKKVQAVHACDTPEDEPVVPEDITSQLQEESRPPETSDLLVTEEQLKRFHAVCSERKIPIETCKRYLKNFYNISSSKDIKKEWYDDIIRWAEQWRDLKENQEK